MDVAALVISIVSVLLTAILAGFGVLLQWLISRDTRQQATEIRQDVGNFKTEASALLGEIRGLTTETRQSQERQVETMINALVARTTEATTTGAAGVIERIDAIEDRLRAVGVPSEELMSELGELRSKVEALSIEIPRAAQEAAPIEPTITRIVVMPREVNAGETVVISLLYTGIGPNCIAACGVATPDGKTVGATKLANPAGRLCVFAYPKDFPGADTNARGGYLINGELWRSGAPGVVLARSAGEFVVY
jgi:hypothetical protein